MKKINVRNHNGRCLVRFTYKGIEYSLTKGSYSDTTDRARMELIAKEIAISISDGSFEGIDKYKDKTVVINRNVVKAELINRLEDNFCRGVLKHLDAYKGNIRNNREAKKFFDSMDIATSTKRRYYTAIRSIPVLREVFTFEIKAKKGEKKKAIEPFTLEEVKRIKEKAEDSYYFTFISFLLATGCRPSEAIGLKWRDVEFENKRIRICRSLSRNQSRRGERREKETKTGVVRFVPLVPTLYDLLLHYKENGILFNPLPVHLVFITEDGKIIDDELFCKGPWKTLLKRAEVRYRSPYNCRHTFISHQLANGVDVATVASWVGNSPEIIYKHYAGMVNPGATPVSI